MYTDRSYCDCVVCVTMVLIDNKPVVLMSDSSDCQLLSLTSPSHYWRAEGDKTVLVDDHDSEKPILEEKSLKSVDLSNMSSASADSMNNYWPVSNLSFLS